MKTVAAHKLKYDQQEAEKKQRNTNEEMLAKVAIQHLESSLIESQQRESELDETLGLWEQNIQQAMDRSHNSTKYTTYY